MGNTINYYRNPGEYPYDHGPLEFDPNYGFAEPRKPKDMRISWAELESMQVPHEFRSFCLHKILAYKECWYHNFPFSFKCNPQQHAYMECENEEAKDRMKDYEREKRLMQRRNRIRRKQQAKEEENSSA